MTVVDESRTYGSLLPGYVLRSLELEAEDGKQVELRKGSTALQWRYVGDPAWNDLVALSEVTGPAGATGTRGPEGLQGVRGLTGLPGPQGAQGTQWLYGPNEAVVEGRPGDWFLKPDGSTFKWLTDSWVAQGSIRGPKPVFNGTSDSSHTYAGGSKVFNLTSGCDDIVVGNYVRASLSTSTTAYLGGQVTARTATSLTIQVVDSLGTGTGTSWNLGLSGNKGAKGDQGIQGEKGDKGDTGATGPAGTDGIQNVTAPLQYDTGTKTLSIDTSQLGTNAVQSIGYTWLFSL